MAANETIGKWAVEKGLLDCWHECPKTIIIKGCMSGTVPSGMKPYRCMSCGIMTPTNPDYSIYENLAPVLEAIEITFDVNVAPLSGEYYLAVASNKWAGVKFTDDFGSLSDLPTTLRDMVAELISKGEV